MILILERYGILCLCKNEYNEYFTYNEKTREKSKVFPTMAHLKQFLKDE